MQSTRSLDVDVIYAYAEELIEKAHDLDPAHIDPIEADTLEDALRYAEADTLRRIAHDLDRLAANA